MIVFKISFFVFAAVCPTALAKDYIWPSPYDEIEDIYALQQGYHARNMAKNVLPCKENGTGAQHAADWLRTAFHDMITYDAATRSGGLDGSIWLELDREENTGRDFKETFADLNLLYSPKVSAADLLALGVVVMHSSCGGTTKIPFRYGRTDAEISGPHGVPRRDDPLHTLMDKFATAGFDQADMIALTACGHTLGGLHPVGNGTHSDNESEHDEHEEDHQEDHDEEEHEENEEHQEIHENFDTSPNTFDNRIAVEYLDGTTKNPLVIGANKTTNSDLLVFSSDDNRTISELARNRNTFESRCSNLFRRMIDSVPRSVELSDILETIDVKPYITGLYLNGANQLIFSGRIRVRSAGDRGKAFDPNSLALSLSYAFSNGTWSQNPIETFYSGDVSGLYGETFAWFEFEVYLQSGGISKFNIELYETTTGNKTIFNNQGSNYPILDDILLQKAESCVTQDITKRNRDMTAAVLVRSELNHSPLRVDMVHFEGKPGTMIRGMRVEHIPLNRTDEKRGDYILYKAPVRLAEASWKTTFDIVREETNEAVISFVRTEKCPEA